MTMPARMRSRKRNKTLSPKAMTRPRVITRKNTTNPKDSVNSRTGRHPFGKGGYPLFAVKIIQYEPDGPQGQDKEKNLPFHGSTLLSDNEKPQEQYGDD